MRRTFPIAIVVAALAGGGLMQAQASRTTELQLKAAQQKEEVEGDLKGAIEQYKKLSQTSDRAIAARALVRMAGCYQKLGDGEAQQIYERVAREFADQADSAAMARTRLADFRRPAGAAAQAARQVWAGEGVDNMGGLSGDGRYLSFTDGSTGDLALRDLRDGTSRRLTNTGGWNASGDYSERSILSPDGRQAAYAWFTDKTNMYDLRVVSTSPGEAGRVRTVHRSAETTYVEPHAWTPDGRSLLIVRALKDRTYQIAFVSLTDGSLRVIKTLDWRHPEKAALSPDGRVIAYDVPAGDTVAARDIFLLAADGSRETAVVQSPANDRAPMWSPDGSYLLFLSDRTGTDGLWAVTVVDGKPKGSPIMLKADLGRVIPFGIAHNGTFLYFSGSFGGGNPYVADLNGDGTVRGAPRLVTERFLNANGPGVWSPDGESLAYYSFRGPRDSRGTAVLVMHTMETGDEREIPLRLMMGRPQNAAPRWFPDGKSLLVVSREQQQNRFDYHRLEIATGKTEFLVSARGPGIPQSVPELTADGRAIFLVEHNVDRSVQQLLRFDLATREKIEVLRNTPGRNITAFASSPDGAQVAYLMSGREENGGVWTSSLGIVPATGGPSREVFRGTPWVDGSRFASLAWTPDQRYLLFVRPDDGQNPPQFLWRVAVNGGAPQKTGVSGVNLKVPRVHPNGTRIAFRTGADVPSEVWVLENFLPPSIAARK